MEKNFEKVLADIEQHREQVIQYVLTCLPQVLLYTVTWINQEDLVMIAKESKAVINCVCVCVCVRASMHACSCAGMRTHMCVGCRGDFYFICSFFLCFVKSQKV